VHAEVLTHTSREHEEGVLEELICVPPVSLPLLWLGVVLLAEVEVAQRYGERKVGQLGQVPVLLQHTHTHTHTRVFVFNKCCTRPPST